MIIYFDNIIIYFDNIIIYFDVIITYFDVIITYFDVIITYFDVIVLYFDIILLTLATHSTNIRGCALKILFELLVWQSFPILHLWSHKVGCLSLSHAAIFNFYNYSIVEAAYCYHCSIKRKLIVSSNFQLLQL
jgi:hypothetical protein